VIRSTHPDLMPLADAPGGIEQAGCRLDFEIGAAEFAAVSAFDLAAELGCHGHLAVTDAEHRHAGIEDCLRRARRAPSTCIDSGPPERITAFGSSA
jgi:hypothetical protein